MGAHTPKTVTAIGLMSGTSMDGIDLAVLTTDGEDEVAPGPAMSASYAAGTQGLLREAVDAGAATPRGQAVPENVRALWRRAGEAVTADHLAALNAFAEAHPDTWEKISLVGFHGQTVLHRPDERLTVQLGDGEMLAKGVSRDVVFDFRSGDVAAGGQGAPLAPLYHRPLVAGLRDRETGLGAIAVLNMGGVGNVTWVGADGSLLAFDTGPANGPLDDWMKRQTGSPMDEGGHAAMTGKVTEAIVTRLASHPYFAVKPPKSLDRLDFDWTPVKDLSTEDGAATLAALSAEAVRLGMNHLPDAPDLWVVCGGGRKNPALMNALKKRLPGQVLDAEEASWRGDDLEAEAFAYLAVRVLRGLPLSLPETTGVPEPCKGGRLVRTGNEGNLQTVG